MAFKDLKAIAAARHPPAVEWFRRAALVAGAFVLPLTIVFTLALATRCRTSRTA